MDKKVFVTKFCSKQILPLYKQKIKSSSHVHRLQWMQTCSILSSCMHILNQSSQNFTTKEGYSIAATYQATYLITQTNQGNM